MPKVLPDAKNKSFKMTASHIIYTDPCVRSGSTVPVICQKQDQLIGERVEDYSDADGETENGQTLWSRVSYKLQLQVPKLDLSVTNPVGQFDDVIGVGGTSLFLQEYGVAVEITLMANKTMHTGIPTIESEFIKNKVDREKYHGKLSKYYIVMY